MTDVAQTGAAGNHGPRTSQRRSLAAGAIEACLLPRAAYAVRYVPVRPVIGFAFETQTGQHAFASDRRTPYRTWPNSLAFTPVGCEVFSQSEEGGEYLTVAAEGETLASLAGETTAVPRFNDHADEVAMGAAHALRRMLLAERAPDATAFETAVAVLADRALGIARGALAMPAAARSMTPRRLRIVQELVEAQLAEGLSITDMARAVDLSTGFFIRAFRAATGQPPHAYVLAQRVARARILLTRTALTGAEIAAATGFCHQAHMIAVFQRHLGLSPARYRAQAGRESRCMTGHCVSAGGGS